MKRTTRLKPISDKQRALKARELPYKVAIIKRAKNRCEYIDEHGERCTVMGSMLYPLQTHHKGIGADREEIKSEDDGEALCLKHHLGGKHGLNIILGSQPKWTNESIKGV